MGGCGSGRVGWKCKVEECRSLDVNRLHREGCLAPAYSGGWNWMRDGKRTANISMQCNGMTLTLFYRIRQNRDDWRDIRQPIKLDSTQCRFGGSRPWFICPGIASGRRCRRRVAKLHAGGTYFLCRQCYQLVYESQSESDFDRLLRRANKLRTKLGGEPSTGALIARKPKGMHWKTYESRVAEIDQLEDDANRLFIAAHQHRWPEVCLLT